MLAPWDNAQAVGKIPRNYEESSVTVDEQLYLLAVAGGPGESRRYAEQSHRKYRTIAPVWGDCFGPTALAMIE